MTIKSIQMDPDLGYAVLNETYGGQNITITRSTDMVGLITWWRKWGPLFNSSNPAVQASIEDMFQQLVLMEKMSDNHTNQTS